MAKTVKVSSTVASSTDLAGKITVLVPSNPKRPGSLAHSVFECYAGAPTVAAFKIAVSKLPGRASKLAAVALKWDAAHDFIKIS